MIQINTVAYRVASSGRDGVRLRRAGCGSQGLRRVVEAELNPDAARQEREAAERAARRAAWAAYQAEIGREEEPERWDGLA